MDPAAAAIADQEFARTHPGPRLRPSPYVPGQEKAADEWVQNFAKARETMRQQKAHGVAPGQTCLACTAAQNLCEIEKVKIKCGHGKRKYVAVVGVGANTQQLEVISARIDKEKISLETIVKKSLCTAHEHRAKHYRITHAGQVQELAGPKAEFEVVSPLVISQAPGAQRYRSLWGALFPLNSNPERYEVEATACKGAATTKLLVRVFPAVKWEVNYWFKVNMATSVTVTSKMFPKTTPPSNFEAEQGTGIAIALEAKCEYDNRYHTVGTELKYDFKEKMPWIRGVMTLSKWLRKILYYAGNINVIFPEVNFGGIYSSEMKELENAPEVTYDATFTFGGYPLIGGTIEIELIDLILTAGGNGLAACGIACAPAVATFLKKVRSTAAGGVGRKGIAYAQGNVSIKFSVSSGIETGVELEIRNGKAIKTLVVGGGTMAFKIKGEASATGELLTLSISAGASIELTGSDPGRGVGIRAQLGLLAVKDANGRDRPYLTGGVKFFGAKIEILGYISVKVDWVLWTSNERRDVKYEISLLEAGEWSPKWALFRN